MTDKFKAAFKAVRAGDSLKANTLRYLYGEIQKRKGKSGKPFRWLIAAPASFAVLFAAVFFTGCLYFTPASYVDVDVNPSVGLALNRFDRVIGARAYNGDGDTVLAEVSVRHKSYADALTVLLEAMHRKGYITNGGLASVTLQTDSAGKENALLPDVRSCVTGVIAERCPLMQVEVFAVDADTRSQSRGYGISPAKYLAIRELMEVDPGASIEGCRGRSIREIQTETEACMRRSGGNGRHMGGMGCRGR